MRTTRVRYSQNPSHQKLVASPLLCGKINICTCDDRLHGQSMWRCCCCVWITKNSRGGTLCSSLWTTIKEIETKRYRPWNAGNANVLSPVCMFYSLPSPSRDLTLRVSSREGLFIAHDTPHKMTIRSVKCVTRLLL